MDKKEARKILGVSKDASKAEIERKYAILLKKHRQEVYRDTQDEQAQQNEDEINPGSAPTDGGSVTHHDAAKAEYDFDLITEAYNTLMGYKVEVREEAPSRLAVFLKKFGLDEKKTDNFLHYYKYYILVGILIVITMIISIGSCVNRPDYDFNIAFIGKIYYYDSVDALRSSIKEKIQIIEEPGIDGAFLSEDGLGEQQYAMEMKAMTLLYAGDIDVFILDRTTYERYAKLGAFMSLDESAPRLGVDTSKHQDLVLAVQRNDELLEYGETDDSVEGDQAGEESDASDGPGTDTAGESSRSGEKHLYDIYITDSKELKEAGIVADEMVAAIFAGCQQLDKAEEFLRFLLK